VVKSHDIKHKSCFSTAGRNKKVFRWKTFNFLLMACVLSMWKIFYTVGKIQILPQNPPCKSFPQSFPQQNFVETVEKCFFTTIFT
jgi:hypothetical protein